jgi:hypothetical protein
MISIDKSMWFVDIFAEALSVEDIIRQPLQNYPLLSNKEKDQLRQTQILIGECVQVLGIHEDFSLIRKFEKTLGWVKSNTLKNLPAQKEFILPKSLHQKPLECLTQWKGTIYEFGGLSVKGIDCSGLSQVYFFNVHNKIIPKNSRDQRKLGSPVELHQLQDHDLIFCHPLLEKESHHVAIFFDHKVWHSRREGGVISQEMSQFTHEHEIEAIRRILHEN